MPKPRDRTQKPPTLSPRDYVLYLQGRRDYSAKELRDRMRRRGYEEAVIGPTIEQLAAEGLQSDARYAQTQVRWQGSRSGNRKIRQKLSANGVETAVIEAALDEATDETERALLALQRFAKTPLDQKLKAKVYRFMASRGFGFDTIRKACEQIWGRNGALLEEDEA